jgi:hypothetical protein
MFMVDGNVGMGRVGLRLEVGFLKETRLLILGGSCGRAKAV